MFRISKESLLEENLMSHGSCGKEMSRAARSFSRLNHCIAASAEGRKIPDGYGLQGRDLRSIACFKNMQQKAFDGINR
jgi:hypothetical protein